MPDNGNCPYCAEPMTSDNLYLRGIAGALLRSESDDVGIFSRAGLEQIDLRAISRGNVGAQAVIPSLFCQSCGAVSFRSR